MPLIYGSIGTSTPAPGAVEAMAGAWPDLGQGRVLVLDPSIAVGAVALGPFDGAAEAAWSTQGSVTVVADARIDNRTELQARLGLDPSCDDLTLLHAAWQRWRREFAKQIEGDFAVFVWDQQRRELCCARDVVGSRPFYYRRETGSLVFASEIAGVLAHPDVRRRLDRTAAVNHALSLHHDRERTLFEGVRRLPGGTTLAGPPDRDLGVERFAELRPEPRGRGGAEWWAEELRHEIERAVARRIPSRGLVAAHLSGGLDSSAVTAVAASVLSGSDRRLEAISFSAPPETEIAGAAPVDAALVEAVRERTGVEVHHPPFALLSFAQSLSLAAPGMMPPPYSTSAVHRSAAARGVHTILSGWGGDEGASFNGRSHLSELVAQGRVVRLTRELRALEAKGVAPRPLHFLWVRALAPFVPDSVLWWRGRFGNDPLVDRARLSALRDDAVEASGVEIHLRHPPRVRPSTLRTQTALLESGHLVDRIEAWSADARRFGVGYAYPLLDPRVLGVALAAPSGLFLRDGISRWLFRQAMEVHLPPQVAWRANKKDSFAQQRQAARAAGGRWSWSLERVRRMIDAGDDLGGTVDLGRLGALTASVDPAVMRRSRDLRGQVPAIGVGLIADLHAFCEHNGIAT